MLSSCRFGFPFTLMMPFLAPEKLQPAVVSVRHAWREPQNHVFCSDVEGYWHTKMSSPATLKEFSKGNWWPEGESCQVRRRRLGVLVLIGPAVPMFSQLDCSCDISIGNRERREAEIGIAKFSQKYLNKLSSCVTSHEPLFVQRPWVNAESQKGQE